LFPEDQDCTQRTPFWKHSSYPSGRDNSFKWGSRRGFWGGVPGMGESVEKMCSYSWTVLWRILTLGTDIINKFKKYIYISWLLGHTLYVYNCM
jgi:hypothetical protein